MNQVSASKFKTHCLKLIDQVSENKAEYVITKRGKPLAKIVAYSLPQNEKTSLFGIMKGSVRINGDIVAPTGEEWNALK